MDSIDKVGLEIFLFLTSFLIVLKLYLFTFFCLDHPLYFNTNFKNYIEQNPKGIHIFMPLLWGFIR